MDALRTAVSHMSHCDSDLNEISHDANIRKAIKLIARFPTIVASFSRIKTGYNPLSPDYKLSHGANFLYMLNGEKPDELEAKVMEKDLRPMTHGQISTKTFQKNWQKIKGLLHYTILQKR